MSLLIFDISLSFSRKLSLFDDNWEFRTRTRIHCKDAKAPKKHKVINP